MLIDGEKWACEACVRGHRVSSCHHSDRPLTHINKKGRPVSQCTHCRGLRKSRTTHVKCECGDKKKNNSNNNNNTTHLGESDSTGDNHPRCGCSHGQRCSCALKKEHHLDVVPETGLPPAPPVAVADLKKPRLTTTKSESTLTIFRDGHHKPAYKHNDMAHKCGVPYTIPRSHTIHSTTDLAQRSADLLPGVGQTATAGQDASHRADQTPSGQRLVKSEHGSPESAPVLNLEQINTQIPPLDISSFSPFGTTESPLTSMTFPDPFQDSFQDQFFASEADFPLGSAGLSAPPVDWSSFPLYRSSVSATANSQPPSYASFDYNGFSHPGIAASSSGDISEIDEFGPLPGLTTSSNDIHDLNSVSDGSDSDHYRFSSSSSFIGLPQAQLLSSNNLESIDIDDFLKSANESTAALEHQLQANLGLESKSVPSQTGYTIPQAQLFTSGSEPLPGSMTTVPMTTSPTDAIWASSLYDSASAPLATEDSFPPSQWSS